MKSVTEAGLSDVLTHCQIRIWIITLADAIRFGVIVLGGIYNFYELDAFCMIHRSEIALKQQINARFINTILIYMSHGLQIDLKQ